MKIIKAIVKEGDNILQVEEHINETLKAVLEIYGKQDVDLYLERWDESKTGVGHEFVKVAFIGNCQTEDLTSADYYQAYDRIF